MFEELMSRVRRAQAEFEFELARTLDPYRLDSLLDKHQSIIRGFQCDAETMVEELEEGER